jgi:hypothetical protein
LGWEPVVLCVNEKYIDGYLDELLVETLPDGIEIHKVNAWPEKYTRKLGVGRIGFRSFYHFKKRGTQLLGERKFDLVFFSTSIFHICTLGRYWKQRFGVPFVIDMQDPWRNDFLLGKSLHLRSLKFWMNHFIDKKMEAYTMPYSSGILSVSQSYIDTLHQRYSALKRRPALLLPFGTSEADFQLVRKKNIPPAFIDRNNKINVVYMGALTQFFLPLIKAFFKAFTACIPNRDDYHFYFIGTLYNQSIFYKQLDDIGNELNISHLITEIPQRVPYFTALATLMHADILFVPGSIDKDYNASKIYNNILSGKPIFSIFHENSLVKEAILTSKAGMVVETSDGQTGEELVEKIKAKMDAFSVLHMKTHNLPRENIQKYMSSFMAKEQINFFNQIVD